MADINTLLGLGLGEQDNMQALANQLRGQQQQGQMLGMSTLAPVARLGQQQQQNANQAAKRGGVLRQSMERENTRKSERDQDYTRGLAATKLAHKRRLEHAAAQKKADTLTFDDFKPFVGEDGQPVYVSQKGSEVFKLDENGDIQKTTMKGLSPYNKPTSGGSSKGGIYTQFGSPKQQKDFEDTALETQNQLNVFGQFKPEYASDSYIPLMGSLENFIAQELPKSASEEMIKQQGWWREYKKQYENIERHKLFGSALTEAEIKAWKSANVSPNSSPEQVQDAMETLKYLTRKLAHRSRDNAIAKNRDPEYIKNNYGYLENYGDFTDLSNVPEGFDRNEWEELTYSERQQVLDMGIQ